MMKKKMLVISQIQIWDLKENAGKAVMDKTFKKFGEVYDLTIIAPGDEVKYNDSIFIKLNNKFEKKIGSVFLLGHLFRYFVFYLFYLDVKNLIKKHNINPDMVYLVGYYAAFTGKKIFKDKKFTINRYYGVAWNEKTFDSMKDKIKLTLRKYCFRNFANMIVMTNDGTKGDLFFKKIGYQGNKFYFLKNGIETTFELKENFKSAFLQKHNLDSQTLFLLTVSRLAAWKKVERAIEAMVSIQKEVRNAVLVVVGSGEEQENLMAIVEKLNIQKSVIFAGAVSHDVLPNYYNLADVFLSLYDYSNAGNPLFEAMLHKKAIVTINNGDTLNFINKESACIIDDYNPKQLVDFAVALLKDKTLNAEKGEKARTILKNSFQSWEERICHEVDLINENYNLFLEKNNV